MMKAADLKSLEDQRLQLVQFIEQCTPQGSRNNKVTIVFDGREEFFGGMSSSASEIVFSQGGSADDLIKKIVTEAANAKSIVVVSDDRDVQYAVRALGAKVCSVKDFLRKKIRHSKEKSDSGNPTVSKKHISKTDETNITTEMGEIWLDPEDK